MCVIIYKPAGVKLPNSDILDTAYQRNPHGCGLVSPNIFYKGLSYNSFKKHLKVCSESESILIHFRFATHGSVKRSNCHPFYDAETDTFFMHNGVLNGIRPNKDRTDSECAFRWFLQPIVKKYGLHSKEMSDTVKQIMGFSKFAFMQGSDVRLFGVFLYFDGCFYSNLRFL